MIIYFSGNGNTQWCAMQMASATADKAFSLKEMASLTDSSSSDSEIRINIEPNEPLGIFFPVHGWKPPRIVLDFITRIRLTTPPAYCYSVCTCGDSIGETMILLAEALAARDICLSATFSIIMPETYVCLPFMYTDTIANEQRKISEAQKQLDQIARVVNDRQTDIHHLVKGPIPWFFTHIVGSFFNKFMITDRPFKVDSSQCIRCGKCAKACPIGNITYDTNNLPQWQKDGRCTCCMACYHHCPKHAINYGNITKRRGQYFFGHGS